MSFKDLSSKTPLPANDNGKAKAAPATATPGKSPGKTPANTSGKPAAEGAPAPRGS